MEGPRRKSGSRFLRRIIVDVDNETIVIVVVNVVVVLIIMAKAAVAPFILHICVIIIIIIVIIVAIIEFMVGYTLTRDDGNDIALAVHATNLVLQNPHEIPWVAARWVHQLRMRR